jgi:cyd operon protein YbgT
MWYGVWFLGLGAACFLIIHNAVKQEKEAEKKD